MAKRNVEGFSGRRDTDNITQNGPRCRCMFLNTPFSAAQATQTGSGQLHARRCRSHSRD